MRPLVRRNLASAGDNPFGHLALLNALDLRLRATEIVVTGDDARAAELLTAARKLPVLDRIVLRASRAPCRASRAGQDQGDRGERGLRLCRRDLLTAGDAAAGHCRGRRRNAPLTRSERSNLAASARRSCPPRMTRSMNPPRGQTSDLGDHPCVACCVRSSSCNCSSPLCAAADEKVLVELNNIESADNRCRLNFVVENKSRVAIESMKLDLVVRHRWRYSAPPDHRDGPGARGQDRRAGLHRGRRLSSARRGVGQRRGGLRPGEPGACLDGLGLSSRIKALRLYK